METPPPYVNFLSSFFLFLIINAMWTYVGRCGAPLPTGLSFVYRFLSYYHRMSPHRIHDQ